MGRRKIEIKAIKDDRNRSVTFLKRKGGLFKKAYELSELCSVDVAVIIFGQNKRIYEFSSAPDVNHIIQKYYQYPSPPHEHKGPQDFRDKKDGDDDDDEDEMAGSPRPDSRSPPQQPMIAHLHAQGAFQHMGTPSASPPMPNGGFQRHPSPAPHHVAHISRPGSRAHMRHPSGNLGPPQMQHPHGMGGVAPPRRPDDWAFVPNPPIYTSDNAAHNAGQMGPRPSFTQPPQINYSQVTTHQIQQTSHPQQQPMHHHAQMYHPQDPQRQQMHQPHPPPQSIPPPPQQHMQNGNMEKPDQQPPVLNIHGSPQPQPAPFHSPPPPQPGKLIVPNDTNKHASIFTPVEEKVSHLHAHLEMLTKRSEPPPSIGVSSLQDESPPRSLSLDIGATVKRSHLNGVNGRPPPPQVPRSNPPMPARTSSTPAIPTIQPPSRTNSLQTDPKRPKLKVQIPNEPSDDEKTAQRSPHATPIATLTPLRELPLPSPRNDRPDSSIPLSAGASGPPNPFARPAPPSNGVYGSQRSDDTPISALPSRFISDQLLPSPSTYNHWAFDKDSSNNFLPSPLPFQTPINTTGPSFRDEDPNNKRKISDGSDESQGKRLKV